MGRGGGAAAGGDLLTSQHRGVEGDESGYCELPGDAAATAVIPRATVPQQHPSPTEAHTPKRHAHPPHGTRLGSGELGARERRTAQTELCARAPQGWRGLGGRARFGHSTAGLLPYFIRLVSFLLLQPSPPAVGGRLEGRALAVSLGAVASPTLPLQGTVGVRGGGQSDLRGREAHAEGWELEALYQQGPAEEPGACGCSYVCRPVRGREIGLWFICVFIHPPAGKLESEDRRSGLGGRRGAGLGLTWVLFLSGKRGGLLFLDWT